MTGGSYRSRYIRFTKFFLGLIQHRILWKKESACGCAGVFSAHGAVELYAEPSTLLVPWTSWRFASLWATFLRFRRQ